MTTDVTEAAPEDQTPQEDPDVTEALAEESDILTRQMEAMKLQHFQERLIAVSSQNRKLVRQLGEQAAKIEELEMRLRVADEMDAGEKGKPTPKKKASSSNRS
jgi:hypothetical protein